MSNGYGIDFYGVAYYGYSQPADYSVAPFRALQTDYGKVTLVWSSPNQTTWKNLMLVRSIYGYPSTPSDGNLLTTISPSTMVRSYDDVGLTAGRIYYYTMFINIDAQTWDVGDTYSLGETVLYNNLYWRSLQSSNLGNTPAVGSAFWASTQYQPTWFPAGYVASLVVNNYGYTELLYGRTPQPYKVANSDLFANTIVDNPALFHYLSLFGYHLDMTKTEYDLYLDGNDPDIVSAHSLDILGQQLGFNTDYISSPQLRRQRVKNASVNYRMKGTSQSIHNAIASITGWDSEIIDSINMLHDGDQSAFVHPSYDLWDAATDYFPNQLIQFNGFNYKNLVASYGVAQQPSGTSANNTWWQSQVSTTTTPIINTTVLKNPANWTPAAFGTGEGGFSTWAPSFNNHYTSANMIEQGIATGLPHPTDITISNWNALAYRDTQSVTIDSIANASFGIPYVPNWSNATNYVINNWVNLSGEDYIALRPSGPGTPYGFITPGTNDTFWLHTFTPQFSYDPIQMIPDGVTLLQYKVWDSAVSYKIDDQVQYFGIIYQAINANKNSKPSGYYYSNQDWIYIQPAENMYTGSAYLTRLTTNTTLVNAFVDLEIFDSKNNQQDLFNVGYNAFLARFDGDYSSLHGINDNTLAALGRPWTANPTTVNLWRSNYGMASVDQTIAGTTPYITLTVADGRSDCFMGVTFVTDYTDNAHFAHGIVFRYVDANNFWYATRKTLYKVVAGVETAVGAWTRLEDNDRMMILMIGLVINVYKYNRDGSNSITGIGGASDATFVTATKHGLIQKYSASGAV